MVLLENNFVVDGWRKGEGDRRKNILIDRLTDIQIDRKIDR